MKTDAAKPLTVLLGGTTIGEMKELHYGDDAFFVDDGVAEALERLAAELAGAGMGAEVMLKWAGDQTSVKFVLGRDHDNGKMRILHARPATGEGSHLGLDDI